MIDEPHFAENVEDLMQTARTFRQKLAPFLYVIVAIFGLGYGGFLVFASFQKENTKNTSNPAPLTIKATPDLKSVPEATSSPTPPTPIPTPVSTPAPTTQPEVAKLPVKSTPLPTRAPTAVPSTTAPPAPTQSPTPSDCAFTGVINPAAPTASVSNPGFHMTTESPQLYSVYGYTAQQLVTQLQKCAPNRPFYASTNWQIRYDIETISVSGSNCQIQNNTAVGLSVKQTIPSWHSSSFDQAGLDDKWQTFMANLTTHEQGHIDNEEKFAKEILTGLNSFPITACANIYQAASNYVSTEYDALKQADVDYDAQTDHGATQGATITY